MDLIANPSTRIQGSILVDGDKSISHRAVLFAALAKGVSDITGFLPGEDTRHTAKMMQAMGVEITQLSATHLRVRGSGLHGLQAPNAPLDCGNAGTGMRLMAGVLAGQRFPSTLIGDESLSVRPMRRVMTPLRLMGADIAGTGLSSALRAASSNAVSSDHETAPLHIKPVGRLQGIDYTTPIPSAQVKSCVLLAGLYADGVTTVREKEATRDHTERMLSAFGVPVTRDGLAASVSRTTEIFACPVVVPADPSSAAFFAVAAAMVEGSDVLLPNVCMNPRRTGIFNTLVDMGAELSYENQCTIAGELQADVRVRGRGLRGVRVPKSRVADMIDEFPSFFIAASCAIGESIVEGAEELRVKESDRIGAMIRGLRTLGIDADERPDGAVIQGGGAGKVFSGGEIDSKGDHRIAMSFAIASLRARAAIRVLHADNIATSFPSFVALANGAGLDLALNPQS